MFLFNELIGSIDNRLKIIKLELSVFIFTENREKVSICNNIYVNWRTI